MTPREATQDETDSPENSPGHISQKPFTLQELVLHGRPNWPASVFFACIAVLHAYVAIHSYRISIWKA